MTMAKNDKSTFTGLLLLMTNVFLAVSRFWFYYQKLVSMITDVFFISQSTVESSVPPVLPWVSHQPSSPQLLLPPRNTGWCLDMMKLRITLTPCLRLPVLLLWPVSALAVVSATLAMSSLLPVPLTLLLSPMVSLVLGFLSLPMWLSDNCETNN